MILRKAEKPDYKPVKKLYKTAFPADERAPFFLLRRRCLQDRGNLLIAEQNGEFVGFAYALPYGDMVYLFFLAVAEEKRGKGAGSAILGLLREYYEGKKIFLAREPLDENAENREQRVHRHDFYLKNGFVDLPYRIQEAGVIYDIMSTDADIDMKNYNPLIHNWLGGFFSKLVKTALLEVN